MERNIDAKRRALHLKNIFHFNGANSYGDTGSYKQ